MIVTRAEVIRRAGKYYRAHVLDVVSGVREWWPHRIALPWPGRSAAIEAFGEGSLQSWARSIDRLADGAGIAVEHEERQIARVMMEFPNAVIVGSAYAAAALVGSSFDYGRLVGRARALRALPMDVEPAQIRHILVKTAKWQEHEINDFTRVARFLYESDYSGMTAREVPLPELGTKWLDEKGRRGLLEMILGKSLGLAARGQTIEFKYLDEKYIALGGRAFDSYHTGDTWSLPYEPSTIVIVENKDTFEGFPHLEGGVCLFGSGKAGLSIISDMKWVVKAPLVIYWGDMDADGLEILDGYRARGINARSILMDIDAWRRYESRGTKRSTGKRGLDKHMKRSLEHLTDEEAELYQLLTSDFYFGNRRIEQERILYDDAMTEIEGLRAFKDSQSSMK